MSYTNFFLAVGREAAFQLAAGPWGRILQHFPLFLYMACRIFGILPQHQSLLLRDTSIINLSAAGRSIPVESQPCGFQMPLFSSANKLLGLFVSFSLFYFLSLSEIRWGGISFSRLLALSLPLLHTPRLAGPCTHPYLLWRGM